MKKQSLIRGTLILAMAGIIAKFLGLFFRWPLIMLVGDSGVAYYQIAYSVYGFFLGIAAGAPVAISKLISERSAKSGTSSVGDIFKTSMCLMGGLGALGSITMIAISKMLISALNWDPNVYYSLLAISLAPIFISIIIAYRGFFQGMQNMNPSATSQLIEQVGRVGIGIGLAMLLLPMGKEYAVSGATFGATAGAILGVFYLTGKYIKEKKSYNIVGKSRFDSYIMKQILKIAIPISIGATASSVMALIDTLFVPKLLLQAGLSIDGANELYGQLSGKAHLFTNIPLTISVALCASLVPIISEAITLKREKEFREKVDMAFKFSSVVAFPSVMGLYFLAYPILVMIFPGHTGGYELLKWLSLSIPFIIFYQTTTSILQGAGHYVLPLVSLIIGCIIKIIVTYLLVPIPFVNIFGAAISSIMAYLVPSIINIIYLKIKLNVRIKYFECLVKPGFASVIMIFAVVIAFKYLLINELSMKLASLIAILVGVIIYVILIVVIKVFDYDYIKGKVLNR